MSGKRGLTVCHLPEIVPLSRVGKQGAEGGHAGGPLDVGDVLRG